MAERDDRKAGNARSADPASSGDEQEALDRALQHKHSGLAGDIDSNRNLTGSMTYETLSEQGDLEVQEVDPDDGSGSSRGKEPG